MIYLRQSTASQEVMLGPFLDDADGKTAETALTINATDIKIWKSGATTEANKNSGGATHIAAGRYYCVLDATDTNTIGPMELNVAVSGALPVRRECCVLHANVFDVLFGSVAPSTHTAAAVQALVAAGAVASVTGPVGSISGVTFPANFGALGINASGHVSRVTLVDTTTTNTDMRGTDNALLASGYTAPLDASGVRSALGLASANLDAQLADLPTVAEFEARTLPSASYFDPASDAVANVTTVGSVTTKTGYSLAATGLDLILAESDTDLREAVSIILASVAGTISGAATSTPTIGNRGGAARIELTTDADGNRSSITHTPYAP